MRRRRGLLVGVAVVGLALGRLAPVRAADDEHPALKESLYTGIAVVANVMPGVSALYAPSCLPGYILCKASFALVSLVAAGEQILMSGAQDWTQTEAILHRGFAGDWYLTARHVSGEATPQVQPEPPPPPSTSPGGGQWEPPPR